MSFLGNVLIAAATLAAAVVCGAVAGQPAESPTDASAPADEIVVLGNVRELRRQLRIAEDLVFARFNDINSDDRFDIHCTFEATTGTRIRMRQCASNDWRQQERREGQAVLAQLRGETGALPEQFAAARDIGQANLRLEMLRLAATDEQLAQAFQHLAATQLALGRELGQPNKLTLAREVPPDEYDLPFAVKRMMEVRIGRQPWVQSITGTAFTLTSVTGEVRKLQLACEEGRERLNYQPDVDWILPQDRHGCALIVEAKIGTTFAVLEFD